MKSFGIFVSILIATIFLFALIGSSGGSGGAGDGILVAILLIVYLLPSFIGYSRRHPSCHGILALNIFLGWTLLGWVIAIVWALKSHKSQVQVVFPPADQSNPAPKLPDSNYQSNYD